MPLAKPYIQWYGNGLESSLGGSIYLMEINKHCKISPPSDPEIQFTSTSQTLRNLWNGLTGLPAFSGFASNNIKLTPHPTLDQFWSLDISL